MGTGLYDWKNTVEFFLIHCYFDKWTIILFLQDHVMMKAVMEVCIWQKKFNI